MFRYRLFMALAAASLTGSALAAWPTIFSGPTGQLEIPTKVAVDTEGNVFVCGYYYIGVGTDMFTVKFNRLGGFEWSRSYGDLDKSESATAIAVDSDGNVYVGGNARVGTND